MATTTPSIPPVTLPTPVPTPAAQASRPPPSATPLFHRIATSSDAPRLVTLVRSAYRGDESRQGWTTEADLLDDKRIDEAGILAKINSPDGIVLLGFRKDGAEDGEGTLIVCCELHRRDPTTAYFGMFAVSPKLQAGGVGRQMLEEAERYVRQEWEIRKIEMQVIWTRDELIAWYMRRGYRMTDRREEFPYGDLPDAGEGSRKDLWFKVLEKDL